MGNNEFHYLNIYNSTTTDKEMNTDKNYSRFIIVNM